MDFKSYIAEAISKATNINKDEIESYVEIPKDETNGDFAFPCFRLAKELKQSPVNIANNIKDNIKVDSNIISKIDVVNGFLNFYVAKECLAKETIQKFDTQKEDYGKSNIGEGKTVIVEYSSPNIAKPFHIGHLKTTIIGNSLYKLYKYLGFNTIGINHLGDYGTQFAKLIEGYKRWGGEYDFSTDAIDKLADIYKRINALCEDDEKVLEECRATFKKLEDGDPYCLDLWNKFKDLSVKEFDKIYDLLGVKFDSIKGEAFYSDKMQEIIDILDKSGKLVESQGAKVVNLEDQGISTPCIIQKANGSSIYATRDLAAIMYRARTYDFDKCLYVVGEEQSLHFKQVFAVAKYLGLDEKYTNGLEHVAYGMIRLPEGKMSSRKGNFFKVEDLLDEAISKSKEIIQDRDIPNKELVAKQVGVGAVIFEDLAESRTKNQVFDLKEALNFNGETGPYIQYMTVRTNSVLEKTGYIPDSSKLNLSKITDDSSIKLLKLIDDFESTLLDAMHKNEPSIISRYLIDVAKAFSTFYNDNKILCDDKEAQDARLYITYMTKIVLTNGLGLLGIEVPEKM
mgnify:FL=1